MKVKRYLAGDLPEAVQKIRSELGNDAVILNTKEIRVGGFLGMFRKKRVEVIAAVDETVRKAASLQPAAAAPSAARTAAAAPQPSAAPSASAVLAEAAAADEPAKPVLPPKAVRERYIRGTAVQPARDESVPAAGPEGRKREATAISFADAVQSALSRQGGEAALEPAAAAAKAESVSPLRNGRAAALSDEEEDETTALLRELRSMKEMMIRINRQYNARSLNDEVLLLSQRLARQGVEPEYVEQFAQTVNRRLEGAASPDGAAAYGLARELLREWMLPSVGRGISPATRIVNFVGPTGVGKTTTIAKLAADQAFVHRRQVGFITADTYRIAAVDQLRTYADILNVPLEVVFSPSELSRAYKKLEDRDLLLMDTAGRNYRNELFVSEVNSLLAPGQQAENVLVLSLTHKYSDMKEVAAQFAKYGVRRLLLTKMDETDSFGSVLNLVRGFDFEISYVTCGQTVPDDIRAFDPEDMIARLLGEPAHG
ncbi:MAG: flagellar biosynthesis protein FlhF [Cohnella sp.]|jgi:flagellar biosynthesis protein FlhF|uniref:flagellar biosynthesis protein FlhF n=1 Tax=Cohnella sp. TaxID=1883426 RepID=UPI000E3A76DC|nr:flagellar biosynthesis protein FlhF [Cohnella sp.]REK67263.1 MAG: flagellar biosynthesis protein FlhF [Cohnella sp.]